MDNEHDIRSKVLDFIKTNGRKLIVCGYASYLDMYRRERTKAFNDRTCKELCMESFFFSVLKKHFGNNVIREFDKATIYSGKSDLLIIHYQQLLLDVLDGHEDEIKSNAIYFMQSVDEKIRQS